MSSKVTKLTEKDVPGIVSVLCDAFYDYPVMRYVLGDDKNYDNRLTTLINFFTMARILRLETIFGAFRKSQLIGVALTSKPYMSVKNAQLIELREKTWQTIGAEAKSRYEKLGRVWMDLETGKPHIHLNMLAVRRDIQGSGVSRPLLKAVHRLSAKDSLSQGVSLTTEDPQKVSFYEYMGYQLTGQADVDNVLQTWSFFRTN